MVENDVIKEPNAEGVSSRFETIGDFDIFLAGLQTARGVIVGYDNSRCTVSYEITLCVVVKQLAQLSLPNKFCQKAIIISLKSYAPGDDRRMNL